MDLNDANDPWIYTPLKKRKRNQWFHEREWSMKNPAMERTDKYWKSQLTKNEAVRLLETATGRGFGTINEILQLGILAGLVKEEDILGYIVDSLLYNPKYKKRGRELLDIKYRAWLDDYYPETEHWYDKASVDGDRAVFPQPERLFGNRKSTSVDPYEDQYIEPEGSVPSLEAPMMNEEQSRIYYEHLKGREGVPSHNH